MTNEPLTPAGRAQPTRNERFIDAPPERVFSVLADGRQYARWVVGAKHVVEVDPSWPAPDSTFRHVVGVGLLGFHGVTRVVASTAPTRLVLEVRQLPVLAIRVTIELRQAGHGTRVSLAEEVFGPVALRPFAHLFGLGVRLRNAQCLRRLDRLVSAIQPPIEGGP